MKGLSVAVFNPRHVLIPAPVSFRLMFLQLTPSPNELRVPNVSVEGNNKHPTDDVYVKPPNKPCQGSPTVIGHDFELVHGF